jgi:hypothetical protein
VQQVSEPMDLQHFVEDCNIAVHTSFAILRDLLNNGVAATDKRRCLAAFDILSLAVRNGSEALEPVNALTCAMDPLHTDEDRMRLYEKADGLRNYWYQHLTVAEKAMVDYGVVAPLSAFGWVH